MMALVLFLTFVLLVFLGVPIAFSLGMSALLYLVVMDIPLNVIPQKMYVGIDSFTLLCIPGFVLAGNLMNVGGITNRIIQFANSVIGFIRGGLGLATVGSSMVFAGISGTALAETASLGSVLIPAMKRKIRRGIRLGARGFRFHHRADHSAEPAHDHRRHTDRHFRGQDVRGGHRARHFDRHPAHDRGVCHFGQTGVPEG